jgi:hypothetical protein
VFCLCWGQFNVLFSIFDGLGIEYFFEHFTYWLENGIVVDFKVFEERIVVAISTEDVTIHVLNAGHGVIKLFVLSFFVKVEGLFFF